MKELERYDVATRHRYQIPVQSFFAKPSAPPQNPHGTHKTRRLQRETRVRSSANALR